MRNIRPEITCIHCWTRFPPERSLWVSEHRDLLGDPLLGDDAQLRFLPNRFNLAGSAIDACGQVCREIACPHCHLTLPRALLEREPLFVSILGTPSCGKSFFLAAMATKLRRELPARFGLNFVDADLAANKVLAEYENQLFINHNANAEIALSEMVPKTKLGGPLYHAVTIGNAEVHYPHAFSFLLDPLENHPKRGIESSNKHVAVFYDNAGEHFYAGEDKHNAPGTRHLAESRFLVFLFDPTQDPRWHQAMSQHHEAVAVPPLSERPHRQEAVLREALNRVHKLLKMSDGQRLDRPLIVVLNKSDTWLKLLGEQRFTECQNRTNTPIWALHHDVIERQSALLRNLLQKYVPEICFAAESFSTRVYYVPASALGNAPRFDERGQAFCKPKDIQPWNVTTPFLLGVSLTSDGLIRRGYSKTPVAAETGTGTERCAS